jgi:hypothetical protein
MRSLRSRRALDRHGVHARARRVDAVGTARHAPHGLPQQGRRHVPVDVVVAVLPVARWAVASRVAFERCRS